MCMRVWALCDTTKDLPQPLFESHPEAGNQCPRSFTWGKEVNVVSIKHLLKSLYEHVSSPSTDCNCKTSSIACAVFQSLHTFFFNACVYMHTHMCTPINHLHNMKLSILPYIFRISSQPEDSVHLVYKETACRCSLTGRKKGSRKYTRQTARLAEKDSNGGFNWHCLFQGFLLGSCIDKHLLLSKTTMDLLESLS